MAFNQTNVVKTDATFPAVGSGKYTNITTVWTLSRHM